MTRTDESPDPWAELDALIDAADPLTAAARPAARSAPTGRGGEVVDLSAVRQRRQEDREALLDDAVRAARAAVQIIQATIESGSADIDDAVRALPALHRVLEAYERQEAVSKAGGAVATAFLTIVLDDTPQAPPTALRKPLVEVIDV